MNLVVGQRVKVESGRQGIVVAQPDGDPIVHLDGETIVFYRSQVSPL